MHHESAVGFLKRHAARNCKRTLLVNSPPMSSIVSRHFLHSYSLFSFPTLRVLHKACAGMSRETLERAFEETLGISPYRYMRLHRLNRLHRELRSAHPGERSVTATLSEWGFSELGRTAVEYKRLFGQSPSVTLIEGPLSPSLKLADALITAPSSTFTDL